MAGLIDSAMRPRTVHGVRYKATTLVARQAAYAALGLPPPLTLYADEVLDKQRLAWIVAGIFARFA